MPCARYAGRKQPKVLHKISSSQVVYKTSTATRISPVRLSSQSATWDLLCQCWLSCFSAALLHLSSKAMRTESYAYPLTPPIASAEVVEQDNTTCPSAEALDLVKNTLQPVIQNTTDIAVPCIPQVKGLVSHCPASNCTELFNLVQEEGLIHLSNYYWLVGTTGEMRKVYCN